MRPYESGAWGAINWIPWFEKIPFVNKEDQPFWADWITKQGQFNWSDVDFELVAKNQDGELSAKGKATASLPSRGSK